MQLVIFPVNPMAGEGIGYPTQKPESLLERVINAATITTEPSFNLMARATLSGS
jgi:hypothetical protein